MINRGQGKTRNKGISSIQVHTDDQWITVTDWDAVESAIMEDNSERFHLTKTTPLMSEYFRDKLGYLLEYEVSQTILNNSFIPDPLLDDCTNNFYSLSVLSPNYLLYRQMFCEMTL